MAPDGRIKEILEEWKTIAVYGMSKSPEKAAGRVPLFLQSMGYNIIPINPTAGEIAGLKCYKSLADVEEPIDILEVFRPSEETAKVAEEAAERRRKRGDIAVIWLQEGIVSDEAKRIACEAGMEFVQDRCMLKEYKRCFPEDT